LTIERYDKEVWLSLVDRTLYAGFFLDLTDDFDIRLIRDSGHNKFAH